MAVISSSQVFCLRSFQEVQTALVFPHPHGLQVIFASLTLNAWLRVQCMQTPPNGMSGLTANVMGSALPATSSVMPACPLGNAQKVVTVLLFSTWPNAAVEPRTASVNAAAN